MRNWNLGLAITGFVVATLMSITLLVLWNVYIISDFHTITDLAATLEQSRGSRIESSDGTSRWVVVAMGSTFFAVILLALSLFFAAYLVHRRYVRIQTDWLNMTTHELKLPTANIQLFAQTLLKPGIEPSDATRFVQLILQESRRLDGMVSRILQARRIEGGVQEYRMSVFPMDELLTEIVQRTTPPQFTLQIDKTGRVKADRRLLEIVVDNFVQNARKYGNGSLPVVRLTVDGPDILVEVSDRGIGIPQRFRKSLFRRFYRVPTREHRVRTGTGLGLYITRSVVRYHKGTVGYRPGPDEKGSVFWFRIPEFKAT